MPANIEIKVAVRNAAALEQRIRRISDAPPAEILQEDTFFHTPRGRLKLRMPGDGTGELISYTRSDHPGPKRSEYLIATTDDPGLLRVVLASSLGIRGVVRKRRLLFMRGNTRIHLDTVEGLGTFLELEVVLDSGESDKEGEIVAMTLLGSLGLMDAPRVAGAYIDLLAPAVHPAERPE